jgi:protease I
MAGELNGRRVAILAADGVERVELEQPRRALDDAGARTDVLSIHDGEIAARNNDLEDAGTFGAIGWSARRRSTSTTRSCCPEGR